jgi:PBP1b-binding outer membrane lipoprotein LpoB
VNVFGGMRRLAIAAASFLILAGCRGEPVPRDYQNNPPAATHPVTNSAQTPTAKGLPGPAAESTAAGNVSTAAPNKPVDPTERTATIKDQAPTSTETTGTR